MTDKPITTEEMLEFLDYILGRSDKWVFGDTAPATIGEIVAKGPSEFVPPPMIKPDGETMWRVIRARLAAYDALKEAWEHERESARGWIAAESVQRKRAEKAEAELEQERPLIRAVKKCYIEDLEYCVNLYKDNPDPDPALDIIRAALAYRDAKEGK